MPQLLGGRIHRRVPLLLLVALAVAACSRGILSRPSAPDGSASPSGSPTLGIGLSQGPMVGPSLQASPTDSDAPTESPGPGVPDSPSASTAESPAATPSPVQSVAPLPSRVPIRSLPPGPDPALVAMIPPRVGPVELVRTSVPLLNAGGAGDICVIICPGQPQAFAAAAGVDVSDVMMAVGMPGEVQTSADPYVVMLALRVRGAETSRLAAAWATMLGRQDMAREYPLTVAGKAGTVIAYDWDVVPGGYWQFLYTKGQILFIVADPRQAIEFFRKTFPSQPTPLLVQAIEALP